MSDGSVRLQLTPSKVHETGHDLKVAYVSGDNVLPKLGKHMPQERDKALAHLDSANKHVTLTSESFMFTRKDRDPREIVSANAYLGAHAIFEALHKGADIVICGRASDASPVIACAWYWWSWNNTSYDELAGALIAGHLIECSAYVTGGNFSGFEDFEPERFICPGFPIAEISQDGTCIITKHLGTGGMVTIDTCRSQLLYEIQGNAYLNSDVKAYLDGVAMEQVGEDRCVPMNREYFHRNVERFAGFVYLGFVVPLRLTPQNLQSCTRVATSCRRYSTLQVMLTKGRLPCLKSRSEFYWETMS